MLLVVTLVVVARRWTANTGTIAIIARNIFIIWKLLAACLAMNIIIHFAVC